ncbi:helix-turn-helix domain-containing protein [Kocuria sp.]|uniref:helix-turn-helix domain-containing protein n=1 Tax=Kocuria sp. TaxID=1871328 RepID=UPI0028AA7587|nr:helix-turn-helix domain-containing protein [Kocuria sp.]
MTLTHAQWLYGDILDLSALAGGMTEQAVADFHGVSRSTITRLRKANQPQTPQESQP